MEETDPSLVMTPGEQEVTHPEPGFMGKLILLFSNPSQLFESLKRKSSWLLPPILLILISVIISLIVQPHIMQSVRQETITFLSSIPNLPDGTIEKTNEQFENAAKGGFAKNLLTGLLGGFFLRAVLFFMVVTIIFLAGTLFFGGTAKYIKVMSMYAWVLPIWVLGLLFDAPLMIIKEAHGISLSPAVLVTPDITNPLFFLLRNFNLFTIWAVIILGIGFSVIYGISRGKGIAVMLAVWCIWIVINSFIPYFNFYAYMTGLT